MPETFQYDLPHPDGEVTLTSDSDTSFPIPVTAPILKKYMKLTVHVEQVPAPAATEDALSFVVTLGGVIFEDGVRGRDRDFLRSLPAKISRNLPTGRVRAHLSKMVRRLQIVVDHRLRDTRLSKLSVTSKPDEKDLKFRYTLFPAAEEVEDATVKFRVKLFPRYNLNGGSFYRLSLPLASVLRVHYLSSPILALAYVRDLVRHKPHLKSATGDRIMCDHSLKAVLGGRDFVRTTEIDGLVKEQLESVDEDFFEVDVTVKVDIVKETIETRSAEEANESVEVVQNEISTVIETVSSPASSDKATSRKTTGNTCKIKITTKDTKPKTNEVAVTIDAKGQIFPPNWQLTRSFNRTSRQPSKTIRIEPKESDEEELTESEAKARDALVKARTRRCTEGLGPFPFKRTKTHRTL